jgi:hypothetical protein
VKYSITDLMEFDPEEALPDTFLPGILGGGGSSALGINNGGEVVGNSDSLIGNNRRSFGKTS